MNIGPRVWKTGLAVTITLWLAGLLSLEHTYLAAVAAIISLQPTIIDSLKKGWERMLATAISILLSLVVIHLFGSDPLVIGLTVVVTLLICLRYGLTGSIALATVTVVVIMDGVGETTLNYAVQRIIVLPFIGISVAVIINHFFSPPEHSTLLKKSLMDLNECIELLMMRVVSSFLSCKRLPSSQELPLIDRLHDSYEDAKQNLNLYAAEQGYRWYATEARPEKIRVYERALELLWSVAEKVLDIGHVAHERCERAQEPTTEYSDLLSPLQETLSLIGSLSEDLLENLLEPKEERKARIESQISEIEPLRECLRRRINEWQRGHLGEDHIKSLMEIVTLVYALDQICKRLLELKQIQ